MHKTKAFLKETARILGYVVIYPFRLRKLERRLKRLESDHYEHMRRFAATVAFYEQRIDAFVYSYARQLAELEPKDEE